MPVFYFSNRFDYHCILRPFLVATYCLRVTQAAAFDLRLPVGALKNCVCTIRDKPLKRLPG